MNKMIFFLMLFLLGIMPVSMLYADDFYYNSTTGGVTTEEVWSINFSGQGFSLYAGGPDKQVEMDGLSDSSGQGLKISYRVPEENNRSITAELDGTHLILTGIEKNGRRINRKIRLRSPFFSSFYVMPLHFINSDEEQMDFCILEPLHNSIMKIRAAKEQDETLIIENKPVETVKVRITLPNFLGAFWRSYVWYRKSDGIFVKTEETRGFPGTPRTYMIMKNL